MALAKYQCFLDSVSSIPLFLKYIFVLRPLCDSNLVLGLAM